MPQYTKLSSSLSWALLLSAGFCADASATVIPQSCSTRLLSEAEMSQYTRLERRLRSGGTHPRIQVMGLRVLQKWKSEVRVPVKMSGSHSGPADIRHLLDPIIPAEASAREGIDTGAFSKVRAVRINGVDGFFRSEYYEQGWAALHINRAMGLQATGDMQPVIYSGAVGIFSPEIVGIPGEDFAGFSFDLNQLEQMVKDGRIDAALLSEAEGFHFLIGDTDGRSGNFILTPTGQLLGFDFDNAFLAGFSWSASVGEYLGHIPPLLYTERFARGLDELTEERLRACMVGFNGTMIRQVAFRRDLMKEEIRARGASAILRGNQFPLDLKRD